MKSRFGGRGLLSNRRMRLQKLLRHGNKATPAGGDVTADEFVAINKMEHDHKKREANRHYGGNANVGPFRIRADKELSFI